MGAIVRNTVFCVIVALYVLLFISCSREEVPEQQVIRPVRYKQIFVTGGKRTRYFSGVAQAGVESRMSFKVAGTVKRVAVKVGDKIRAGALLAELDDKNYRLEHSQAQASLNRAKAQLRNAASQYERIRSLYESENVSLNELENARTAFESAQASVQVADQSLKLAQLQLDYTRLTASVESSVAVVDFEENENVSPGEVVMVLTSGSNIEVTVSVPEVLIANIREGTDVTVTFDALEGKEFEAVVREVGVTPGEIGTTFPVIVRLKETDPGTRPGMAAEVAFSFESESNRTVMLVPSQAVIADRGGWVAFIVEPKENGLGLIYKKTVTVGDLTPEGLEVFEGLADGDRVVTAGMSKITGGMTVKLLAAKEN